MKILKIESAFNRIPNGNFSHGLSNWIAPNAGIVVNGTQTGAPTDEGIPRYLLSSSDGKFWADIPYKDLSIFPSRVHFFKVPPSVPRARPLDYRGRYLLYAPIRNNYVRPFMSLLADTGQDGPTVVVGDPLFLTDVEFDLYSGEYRVERIMQLAAIQYEAVILPTRLTEIPPLAAKTQFGRFQYKRENAWTNNYMVKFDPDVDDVARPDGSTGIIRNIDYFLSERYSGQITGTPSSMSGPPGEYMITVPVGGSYERPYKIAPTTGGVWIHAEDDWFIASSFESNVLRELPVALYDLTLAYTTHVSHDVMARYTAIEFYDEMGQLVVTQPPAWIDPPDPPTYPWPNSAYYRLIDLGGGWRRYICHFLFETAFPVRGTARLMFNPAGGTKRIGDVVLLKGDYVQELSEAGPTPSGPVLDILEHPISQESGIMPQGTIIAYVGGAVCPPGFLRVEGVGEDQGSGDLEGWQNHIFSGSFANIFRNTTTVPPFIPLIGIRTRGVSSAYLHLVEGEPRTYFHIPPTSRLIRTNGDFREDVVPGCVLELRFAQGGQAHPSIGNPEEAVILQNKNQLTPTHYSIFAIISYAGILYVHDVSVPSNPPVYEVEIVGDFKDLLDAIAAGSMSGDVFVWRSGLIAHKQRVSSETLGSNPVSPNLDWRNSGGYGTVGGVHRHLVEKAVMGVHPDIGQQGTVQILRIPYQHDTRPTFKASSIPKIRPVLLCQKL